MATRVSEGIGLFNRLIQSSLFSTIFIFNSNIRGIRALFERSIQAILFPIAVIPDIITSLLALFNFTRAKNRNLGGTFELIYNPLKTALVLTAVFAGLSLVAVHSLFLTVVGSSLVYHTGACLYNAYLWLKAPKSSLAGDISRRNIYKKNVLQHGISTFSTSLAIAGILLTMVFAPYLGASILAIGGITIAALIMSSTLYTLYKHFRGQTQPTQRSQVQAAAEEITPASSPNQTISQKPSWGNYHYREFRSEKLIKKDEDDRKFLCEEIENKKQQLDRQIKESEKGRYRSIWSEREKRENKIQYLQQLQDIIENPGKDTALPPPKKAFQSFWRHTSDVKDIIQAGQAYLDNRNLTRDNRCIEEVEAITLPLKRTP